MKLSFGTKVNNQPNYFIEKIWKGLLNGTANLEDSYHNYQGRYLAKFGEFWDGDSFGEFLEPKIHTIRRDPENKWREGTDIQLIIQQGEPDEFQFAPTIKCLGIQRIQIDYSNLINEGPAVFIDYELVDKETLAKLVVNDGFATIAEFFYYFNEEFSGNLVHWTPLKYQ